MSDSPWSLLPAASANAQALDDLTLPDEVAWEAERAPYLLY